MLVSPTKCILESYHNERSSPAAKQLASVARKMAMREVLHCCQEDDGLKFSSINLWYVRCGVNYRNP